MSQPATVTAVTAAELATLTADPTPVLIDFWATWCGPCRQLAPVLDRLATDLGDQVRVVKVDVDAVPDVAAAYQVTGVPTLVLVRDGQVLWRTTGAKPFPVLRTEVTNALG